MSLQKFLETIKFPSFKEIDEKRKKLILETDPERIYIENVRSYFNTSISIAKMLCKMAVKDGIFQKRIGFECPNENCEHIIKSFGNEPIEDEVYCDHCELLGNERHTFRTNDLKRIEFYQLIKQ